MLKLNIGAGTSRIAGYIPIDRKLGSEAWPLPEVWKPGTAAAELGIEDREYRIEAVEEIRASHVLEHFRQSDIQKVLCHWHDRLRPGGVLKVAVPDLDKALSMREQAEGRGNGHWMDEIANRWPQYITGGWQDENDRHGALFTAAGLKQRLEMAGFEDVQPWETSAEPDLARHPVSVALRARKPEGADPVGTIKMCALMSVPRLGWQDHFGCALRALSPLHMPIRTFTGAFWEQCLQTGLENCVRDGIDWVLTIDYDSLFTAEDVDKLIGHVGNNPNIDAIAAIQCRRGMAYPLMTVKGRTNIPLTNVPVKVDTAHFGLTIIRLDALKDMPRPWFEGKAGEGGSWTHYSRVDPDISFWHKWRDHKKTIYVAPDVRIGHLELMASEFGDDGEVKYVRVKDWMNRSGIQVVGDE